jgi:hypothetical protein
MSIFDRWTNLDTALRLRRIEDAHGVDIFDTSSYLDSARALRQINDALGANLGPEALLDHARMEQLIDAALAIVSLESGFDWPYETYPVTFGWNGTSFTCDLDPEDYAAAALAGTQYYVDVDTGSDVADGLTSETPVKSIHRAITLGNATAAPFRVAVAAGSYPRENGFTATGALVPATQSCAIIGTGLVECWTGSVLTWPGSPDATHTSTYKVARSAVARVINLTTDDANGDYDELTKVADAATCNSTPNSWAQVAGDLYVHRTDEEAPTTANTRVLLLSTANLQTGATSKDIFVSGIDFQGGAGGAVSVQVAATLNAMFVNCTGKFAGAVGVNVNGFAFNNFTGLAALKNCVGACNENDGISGHLSSGEYYMLTIDCIGRNNGRNSALSCNGLTIHGNVRGIDVNGEYCENYGANVIPVNTSQMFCLGTYAHDSYGDVVHGGSTVPTDYQTQNTAELWLRGAGASGSEQSLVASDTSIIRTRKFTEGVDQDRVSSAGATIVGF